MSTPARERVGPYEVIETLAQGGAGVVLRARAADGREVAVKVLRQMTSAAAGRFARERALQAELGLAEGFVPLIDGGVGPRGPWLAMPLVPGGTLRDRLARGPMPVAAAVDLVRRLADALARAHARGIVHRDLKPENILFTADGVPLVTDLGLAKREGDTREGMSLSRTGEFRGTIGYMAPEQLKDAKSVGPAADVFALGAILYECLTGRPTFVGETVVLVLARIASGEVEPLARLRPDAPPWLVQLVDACLARDPARRPPDAAALAAALVAAPAEEERRRQRRAGLTRGLVLGAAPALVVGAALGFVASAALRPPEPAPPPAAQVALAEPEAAPPTTPTTPPPADEQTADEQTADEQTADEQPAAEQPPAEQTGADAGAARPVAVEARWGASIPPHAARVTALAVAREAGLVASADEAGALRLWQRVDGQQRHEFQLTAAATTLALSGDGEHVAYVMSGGVAAVRHLASGDETPLDAGGVDALAVGLDRSGATTVLTFTDARLTVWDAVNRRSRGGESLSFGVPLTAVAVSPDGRTCVVGTPRGELASFDPVTVVQDGPSRGVRLEGELPVRRLTLSPDALRAAALVPGLGLAVWEVGTPRFFVARGVLAGEALDLAFTSDGATLVGVDGLEVAAYACTEGRVTWRHALPWPTGAAAIEDVEDVGGGRAQVLLGDAAGRLHRLDVGPDGVEWRTGHTDRVTAMVSRGQALFTASADGTVRRWSGPDRARPLLQRARAINDLTLSDDGALLAAAWGDGAQALGGLVVVDAERGVPRFTAEGGRPASSAAFSADGRLAFVGEPSGAVLPIALGSPGSINGWQAHALGVRWVRRLADGRLLTSGLDEAGPGLGIWPTPGGEGRVVRVPRHRAQAVAGLAVLLGCDDGVLIVLDLTTGEQRASRIAAHGEAVTALAVSPDGTRAASAGADGTLCLWRVDAALLTLVARVGLERPDDPVTALCFGAQGLLAGRESGAVVLLPPPG